jgi:hypothetical protein
MKPFLISIAILLVVAPVSEAAKFRGQTSQDRRAVVVTEDGLPVRITIAWRALCGDGRFVWDDASSVPPYDERTATFVRDRDRYTGRITGPRGQSWRFHALARFRAHRVTQDKWRGRFRVSGALRRRNGELVTRCESPRIRWRATR